MKRFKDKRTVIVAIYGHPEAYPPTLNCIAELTKLFDRIFLIGRNVLIPTWSYPDNCKTIFSGRYYHVRATEQVSLIKKIVFFFNFLRSLRTTIRQQRPDLILVYDPLALFAYTLVIRFVKIRPLIWYHNHDVFEEDKVRKYSIQWWAGISERKSFNKLDVFSLPADERKKNFPMKIFAGKYFFLPNYPSIHFFGKFYSPKKPTQEIRLIFQGAIAEGHGLEEIAGMLGQSFEGRKLHLTIKGWIRDQSFKNRLEAIAEQVGGGGALEFIGYGPYKDLPLVTSSCHVGIGIHSLNTDLHTSLGKASNKLYEYASVGLPIIVYDSKHYRQHLDKYPWVFFTDLSNSSLTKCIVGIISDYDNLSLQAYRDFLNELNFELNFKQISGHLENLILSDLNDLAK